MNKKLLFLFSGLLLVSCTIDRDLEGLTDIPIISDPDFELIHYWNFNDASSNSALITPNVGNGTLSYQGAYFDDVNEGTEINARNNDEAGHALRLRNPSGDFIMSVPTSGFENIVLTYAITRTNNGPQEQTLSYSVDGVNFTSDGLQNTQLGTTTEFVQRQFDFSQIAEVNNNPDFKIKISFNVNADGDSGNSRFDNITLDGTPIEGYTPIEEEPVDPDLDLFLYWNFNDASSSQSLITPTLGNGSLTYFGSYFDSVNEGTDINARNDDEAGHALRLRNPSGDFIIDAPTSGYEKVLFTFATTRTNNGPQEQNIFYTLDGVNYSNSGIGETVLEITTNFVRYQYDFSHIPEADNNPNFKIKITFDINIDGDSGNSRFDNITFDGVPLEGGNPDPDPDPSLNLIHYWNFNNTTSNEALLTPNLGNGTITYLGSFLDSTTDGTSLNARNDDPAGTALRLRNPLDDLIISLPTTGYENVILKFASARTANGAQQQNITYTTNGVDYTNASITPSQIDITTQYVLYTINFSSIPEANNNPDFKVKMDFDINASGTNGSSRFDNITLEGNQL